MCVCVCVCVCDNFLAENVCKICVCVNLYGSPDQKYRSHYLSFRTVGRSPGRQIKTATVLQSCGYQSVDVLRRSLGWCLSGHQMSDRRFNVPQAICSPAQLACHPSDNRASLISHNLSIYALAISSTKNKSNCGLSPSLLLSPAV